MRWSSSPSSLASTSQTPSSSSWFRPSEIRRAVVSFDGISESSKRRLGCYGRGCDRKSVTVFGLSSFFSAPHHDAGLTPLSLFGALAPLLLPCVNRLLEPVSLGDAAFLLAS